MRVIGGTHRSRPILSPHDDQTTRPITDRVKTSLFDRLTAMGALGGGNVADVFAGTGSLGIEAISRGADHCLFVERDRAARALLEENLRNLGMMDRATVLGVNALTGAWLSLLPRKPLALIFLDPPYPLTREEREMGQIIALLERLAGVSEPGAIVSLRTPERVIPPAAAQWIGPESHVYGTMALHFFERPTEPQPAADSAPEPAPPPAPQA